MKSIKLNLLGYAKSPNNVTSTYSCVTPNKIYEIFSLEGNSAFNILDDYNNDYKESALLIDDRPQYCLWKGCAHICGGNWEYIDTKDIIKWCEENCQDKFKVDDELLKLTDEDFVRFALSDPFKGLTTKKFLLL